MTSIFDPWIAAFSRVDQILRGSSGRSEDLSPARSWRLWGLLLSAGCFYGAVLGSFNGDSAPRILQMIYSAAKIPMLLSVTFLLTLPSFFVINTLFGLRNDFGLCLQALGTAQTTLLAVLASLAPLTAIWYLSVPDYSDAILFNAAIFTVASLAAQISLRRSYRELIARNARHRWMIRIWLAVYAFVGIQMGWVLRPFIGNPDMPTSFFREKAFTNAYEILMNLIWKKF
jgi:hypothetical protein